VPPPDDRHHRSFETKREVVQPVWFGDRPKPLANRGALGQLGEQHDFDTPWFPRQSRSWSCFSPGDVGLPGPLGAPRHGRSRCAWCARATSR
jgi:hypothetical protein